MRSLRFLLPLSFAALLIAANPDVEAAKNKLAHKRFTEAITELDLLREKAPNDKEVTAALADAHFQYAESYLNDAEMPPMRKYPTALREYRKVLTFDKNHEVAKKRITLIENIYRSMNRPIPQ